MKKFLIIFLVFLYCFSTLIVFANETFIDGPANDLVSYDELQYLNQKVSNIRETYNVELRIAIVDVEMTYQPEKLIKQYLNVIEATNKDYIYIAISQSDIVVYAGGQWRQYRSRLQSKMGYAKKLLIDDVFSGTNTALTALSSQLREIDNAMKNADEKYEARDSFQDNWRRFIWLPLLFSGFISVSIFLFTIYISERGRYTYSVGHYGVSPQQSINIVNDRKHPTSKGMKCYKHTNPVHQEFGDLLRDFRQTITNYFKRNKQ